MRRSMFLAVIRKEAIGHEEEEGEWFDWESGFTAAGVGLHCLLVRLLVRVRQ